MKKICSGFRENPRGNQQWTTQRHCTYTLGKTQGAIKNRQSRDKPRTLLITPFGKDKENFVFV
jgi:hypothetical protein